MAGAIELLNPNRQWNIGSKGQLYRLDVSGDININNNGSLNLLNSTNDSIINVKNDLLIIPNYNSLNDSSGSVIIRGNLDVLGTQTLVNTETLLVNDNFIRLNAKNQTVIESGLEVDISTNIKKFNWNKNNNYWTTNGDNIKSNKFIGDLSGSSLLLDGSGSSYYLDYNNLNNKPNISNLLSSNFSKKSQFNSQFLTSNNILTTSTSIQDLSNQFFNYITPSKNNSKIMVYLKLTYFCSIAFSERITIQLWRDNVLLSNDLSLGTLNATGGLINSYNLNFLDELSNTNEVKYYVKYKLESYQNREYVGSNIAQGLININIEDIGSSSVGSSVLTLQEM
jgi:hypothetical protein